MITEVPLPCLLDASGFLTVRGLSNWFDQRRCCLIANFIHDPDSSSTICCQGGQMEHSGSGPHSLVLGSMKASTDGLTPGVGKCTSWKRWITTGPRLLAWNLM
ncbi:unnamed protein product [Urochloa humidicola]